MTDGMSETYSQTIAEAEVARPGIEDRIEHQADSNFMAVRWFKVVITAREILRCSFKDLGWPRPKAEENR